MDYKSGEIYLDGRARWLIANSIEATVSRIAELKSASQALGLGSRDFDSDIQNYLAILKKLDYGKANLSDL